MLKNNIRDLFLGSLLLEYKSSQTMTQEKANMLKRNQCSYCNSDLELLRRAEKARFVNLGGIHGQDFLKVVLQPTYSREYLDSVNGCFLVSITGYSHQGIS